MRRAGHRKTSVLIESGMLLNHCRQRLRLDVFILYHHGGYVLVLNLYLDKIPLILIDNDFICDIAE